MKGGTVVLAASPFGPTFAQGFAARKVDTGLEDWLAQHGITIEESMVLDSQSAALPVPVEREVGGVRVRERSEEHKSELQSLMRISYAVFCLKKKRISDINKQTR